MTSIEIDRHLAAAREANRAGRDVEARAHLDAALALDPRHPLALNMQGMQALRRGEPEQAERSFARAIEADPASPELWLNLAAAHRNRADDVGERRALEGALAIDRRHFMALVRLAQLHERRGEEAEAATHWGGVAALAAQIDTRSQEIDRLAAHAADYVRRQQAALADAIEGQLAGLRAGTAPADRRRFDACLDHRFGRRAIYANQCAGLHYPFLPADEYFDERLFPWLGQIEAEAAVIRAELEALLVARPDAIAPYVAMESGTPDNKWSRLDHSLAWGALHLWKDGQRVDEACALAPRTAAAVEALPLSDLPGRTPTVFFSILQPRTRIPAHTGVSNVRAIIHLPLIVPPGCGFRVGGETREWREGVALAFDDTIEHEAWNDSDEIRAVLIFDVWNPHLAPHERELLRGFYRAVAAVGAAGARSLAVAD